MIQTIHDAPQSEADESQNGGGCSHEPPLRYTAGFYAALRVAQQHQQSGHSSASIRQQQEGHGSSL
jgi:hypothetical protein